MPQEIHPNLTEENVKKVWKVESVNNLFASNKNTPNNTKKNQIVSAAPVNKAPTQIPLLPASPPASGKGLLSYLAGFIPAFPRMGSTPSMGSMYSTRSSFGGRRTRKGKRQHKKRRHTHKH